MDKVLSVGRRSASLKDSINRENYKEKHIINLNFGLTAEEVELNTKHFGKNSFTKKKKKNIISEFFKNLSDPIIRVLLIAMGVNILFSISDINWIEVGGIGMTVFIATFVSTISVSLPSVRTSTAVPPSATEGIVTVSEPFSDTV